MQQQVVFLDRASLQAKLRRPAFEHTWQEYPASTVGEVVQRLSLIHISRLCVAKCAVENRGAMPSDAPTCKASADASGNGERSSRAGLVSSWRRSAPRYRPTLPSTPKALSKPTPVLPSCSNAATWIWPSSRSAALIGSPQPITWARFSRAKYRFSSSVFICTKRCV